MFNDYCGFHLPEICVSMKTWFSKSQHWPKAGYQLLRNAVCDNFAYICFLAPSFISTVIKVMMKMKALIFTEENYFTVYKNTLQSDKKMVNYSFPE